MALSTTPSRAEALVAVEMRRLLERCELAGVSRAAARDHLAALAMAMSLDARIAADELTGLPAVAPRALALAGRRTLLLRARRACQGLLGRLAALPGGLQPGGLQPGR